MPGDKETDSLVLVLGTKHSLLSGWVTWIAVREQPLPVGSSLFVEELAAIH